MRTKKAFKNLVFNFIQQLVGIITSFIVPPLIISKFGSSVNGLVSTIKQIMSYVQLTGAGISSSATYAMYEPINKKDYTELSGIYNATKKMFNDAGNVFSLIVLLVSVIYPFFVKQDVPFTTIFLLVIVMSFAGLSEFYVFGKYQTLLNADQNNYVVSIAQSLGNICNIIVTVTLIKLNQNIVVVQLGASMVYVMRILVLYYYVNHKYRFLDPNVKPMLEKINQKNDAIIHELTALVVWNSSTILISVMIDLKQASVYAVYALVFSGLNMICNIVSNAIYASFGDVIAKKDIHTLHNAFNVYEWFYFLFVGIIYTVAYLMIMPFISIYTVSMTDTIYYLPFLGSLFVIVGVANNIRVPARTLVVASGHFKETRNRSIIEMIINIVGQVIGIYFFGIYGALFGAVLSFSYRSIDFVLYSNKNILHINSLRSLKRFIVNVFISVIVVFAVDQFIVINAPNYLYWCFYATIISLFTGITYLIINILADKKTAKQTFNSFLAVIRKS